MAKYILIVDDEREILNSMEFLLRFLLQEEAPDKPGAEEIRILTASSGEEALEIFKQNPPEGFCAVITDITMLPGISGIELSREIRKSCPSLKIVFISGYLEPETKDEIRKIGGVTIKKPFLMADIWAAIEDCL